MDRRKFITNSTLVGIAGSAALATPSLSQGREKLNNGHNMGTWFIWCT